MGMPLYGPVRALDSILMLWGILGYWYDYYSPLEGRIGVAPVYDLRRYVVPCSSSTVVIYIYIYNIIYNNIYYILLVITPIGGCYTITMINNNNHAFWP